MVMAEQETSIEQSGADEVSGDGAGEPTPEQLQEQRLERLEAAAGQLLQNQQFLVRELRGVQGRADSAHSAIESLQERLEDRYAPKAALRLLEQTVKSLPDGEELWEKHQSNEELAELREKVEQQGKRETKASPATRQDPTFDEYQNFHGPRLSRYAARMGTTLDEAAKHPDWPKDVRPGPGDPTGFIAFNEAAEQVIEKVAEDKARRREPRPRADTQKTAGGGRKDEWAELQATTREGRPLPPSADIDRITRAHFGI